MVRGSWYFGVLLLVATVSSGPACTATEGSDRPAPVKPDGSAAWPPPAREAGPVDDAGSGGGPGDGGGSGGGGGRDGGGSEAGDGGAGGTLTFAVIGDFGDDSENEESVAKLVKGWKPDHVLTVGDDNYPDGAADTIDTNIGKYYADFIGSYSGMYGKGSPTNRFWPTPGNHDWRADGLLPYIDFFSALPKDNGGRYYHKDFGLVDWFAIDSDPHEPDGITPDSKQAQWFEPTVKASKACFKVAGFHHPAYNSGEKHGSTVEMRWPFKDWGLDAVLMGHEHLYERLEVDGLPYFVNGVGGADRTSFATPLPESKERAADSWGAMKVIASKSGMTLEMWDIAGKKLDSLTVKKTCK